MHVIFICAEDGKRMTLAKGKFGLFYRCPEHRYPDEVKKTGKKSCPGRLTLGAAEVIEDMVRQLAEAGMLDSFIEKGTVVNMKACDVRLRKYSEAVCGAVISRH